MNRCFLVEKNDHEFTRSVVEQAALEPGENELVVRIRYSSLNYKDALSCTGHPGVSRNFPHVPGIDAVGEVVHSNSPEFSTGDAVILGHANFGTSQHGGWRNLATVSGQWAVRRPTTLSEKDAIILGTAGFTAAGCVEALQHNGVRPGDGPIVVSGATGGVGCFAVKLLAHLGFEVVAATGKTDQTQWLEQLGASRIISRAELDGPSDRPLLSSKWAGGIDTVGGNTLSTMLRQAQVGGVVSACGVVAGPELPITVYPFILRGVTLCGIDSANTSTEKRQARWNQIAAENWATDLEEMAIECELDSMSDHVDAILRGKIRGRVILSLS